MRDYPRVENATHAQRRPLGNWTTGYDQSRCSPRLSQREEAAGLAETLLALPEAGMGYGFRKLAER
jgi:hypothetical protein